MYITAGICNMPIFHWPKKFSAIDTSLPLVTCIMPTANRQEFIPKAIQYFLQQDYPYKELVIIDDGEKSIAGMLPNLYSIRYFYLQQKQCIGTKRNIACEKAAGSIIIHWDDDDWYANNWITYQVNSILKNEADICGLSHVQFFSVKSQKFYFRKDENFRKNWLSGATLVYRKAFWSKNPFKNIHVGEDIQFVRNKKARIFAHNYFKGFLAIVHATNAQLREL
jgi:glycosyltransferase involved in cell wall biosynthesis